MRTIGFLIFSVLAAASSPQQTVLVAGPSVELYKKAKAKGKPAATLEQGVQLTPTGEKQGKLIKVKTSKPFPIEGWIQKSDTGCRVTGEVTVKKEPVKKEQVPKKGKKKGKKSKAVKEWVIVKSWSGNGIQDTEPFEIMCNEWRIKWQNLEKGTLRILVKKPGKQAAEDWLVNVDDETKDVSYLYKNGKFYLAIISSSKWKIIVEQVKCSNIKGLTAYPEDSAEIQDDLYEKSEEALAAAPVLLKGAMVSILKEKGEWIQVEAAPYPIRIYSVADAETGELLSETVYTGFILKGWIPASSCSPDEKAYYDSTPKEGKLGGIVNETAVYSEKPDEATMKSSKQLAKLEIDGKALKYCRWVELEESEGWSRGFTDGPVKVKGWVNKNKLGPSPNTNPLNTIFMKDFKDYEIIAGTDLVSADTKDVVAKLPGGLEVFKVGVDKDGCIVKTPSPIIVQGLVKCNYLRHLAIMPEKVIDDTGGSKDVTFPERGPKTIDKDKKK